MNQVASHLTYRKELCWVAEKEMFLKGEAGGRKLLAKNALVFGKVTLLR